MLDVRHEMAPYSEKEQSNSGIDVFLSSWDTIMPKGMTFDIAYAQLPVKIAFTLHHLLNYWSMFPFYLHLIVYQFVRDCPSLAFCVQFGCSIWMNVWLDVAKLNFDVPQIAFGECIK